MFSSRVVRARARALSNSLTRGGFFFLFFFLFLLLEDFLATNSNFKARMGLSLTSKVTKVPPNAPQTHLSLSKRSGNKTLYKKIFLVLAQTHTKTRTSHSTPSRVIECIYIHTHEHKHKHAKTHVHSRVRTNALKS